MTISEFQNIITECAELYGLSNDETEMLFIKSISSAFDGMFVFKIVKENRVRFFVSKPQGARLISYSLRIASKVKKIFHKEAMELSVKNRISAIKTIKKYNKGICTGEIVKKSAESLIVKCPFGYATAPFEMVHPFYLEIAQGAQTYYRIHSYAAKGGILSIRLDGKHRSIDASIIAKAMSGASEKLVRFHRNNNLLKIYLDKKPCELTREKIIAYYPKQQIKFIWQGSGKTSQKNKNKTQQTTMQNH